MRNQSMDLLLKFTIYLIKQIEAKKMITDDNLVTVVEWDLGDWLAIDQSAIRRSEICNAAVGLASLGIQFARNTSVKA